MTDISTVATPLQPVPCLVTLRPLRKIFLVAPGADPELFASDTGQILKFSGSELCILV